MRSTILHVLEGPWYGPEEHAFRAISKAYPRYSHAVCTTCGLKSSRFSLRTMDRGFVDLMYSRLQERCDSVCEYDDDLCANGDLDPACVIAYNVPGDLACAKAGVPRDRVIVWNFDSVGDADFTATEEPGVSRLYPMVDVRRLHRLHRKPERHAFTVGFFVDQLAPESRLEPEPFVEAVKSLSDRAGSFPLGVDVVIPKFELLRDRRWLDAANEAVSSLDDSVGLCTFDSDYGWDGDVLPCCDCAVVFGSGRYPFAAVCASAMRVPVVSVGGSLHFSHGSTCVEVKPGDVGRAALWIRSNPDKASEVAERAFRASLSHSEGFNLPGIMEAIDACKG